MADHSWESFDQLLSYHPPAAFPEEVARQLSNPPDVRPHVPTTRTMVSVSRNPNIRSAAGLYKWRPALRRVL